MFFFCSFKNSKWGRHTHTYKRYERQPDPHTLNRGSMDVVLSVWLESACPDWIGWQLDWMIRLVDLGYHFDAVRWLCGVDEKLNTNNNKKIKVFKLNGRFGDVNTLDLESIDPHSCFGDVDSFCISFVFRLCRCDLHFDADSHWGSFDLFEFRVRFLCRLDFQKCWFFGLLYRYYLCHCKFIHSATKFPNLSNVLWWRVRSQKPMMTLCSPEHSIFKILMQIHHKIDPYANFEKCK